MKAALFCFIILFLVSITSTSSHKVTYHSVPGSYFKKADLGIDPLDSLQKQRCEICELEQEVSDYKNQLYKSKN